MKLLYLDLGMGAAGDMLAASLFGLLGEDEQKKTIDEINAAGIPDTVVSLEKVIRQGVGGLHFRVLAKGRVEEGEDTDLPVAEHVHEHHHAEDADDEHEHEHTHDHEHEHEHEHCHDHAHRHHHGEDGEHYHHHHEVEHGHVHSHGGHHHHHTGMDTISTIIDKLAFSDDVKEDIRQVYTLVAEAESEVHGVPVSQIHFHEVGDLDAVADIATVCLLMHKIAPEKTASSAVCVGSGHVHCAHGILPVPAPATALLLKGIPVEGTDIKGELCTPTGAALVRHFVQEFGSMPRMTPSSWGYGMGTREFERLNCVRSVLGEAAE